MEPYLGQVSWFAFTYAPTNWLPCDGRVLPIAPNQALYALLGTTYGGNGQTTFGIPNLNANPPAPGAGLWCIAVLGLWPSQGS